MRFTFLGYVIVVTVGLAGSSGVASAEPKNRAKGSEVGTDKSIDKQLEWEKQVMGNDAAKTTSLRKIAAAQKMADEAAKKPQPIVAPKVKDPNKEGVRAKQEASIGLPIASDQEQPHAARTKNGSGKKVVEQKSSADDALGALVASSLAEDRAPEPRAQAAKGSKDSKPTARGARAKRVKTGPAPSSLDQMFAATK